MLRGAGVVGALAVVVLAAVAAGVPGVAAGAPGGPADPETDRLGWEAGYWYNESIDVDATDGLDAAERGALVGRTMARVEQVRGLEFNRTVPVEVLNRSAFRRAERNRSVPPASRQFENAAFEALFLVGESADAVDVRRENVGVAARAFYSERRGTVVLLAGNASAPAVSEPLLAHELVHALQDQQFNLSNVTAATTRDERLAAEGLVEGDANFVQHRYRRLCDGAWNGTCVRRDAEGGGEPANLGVYFADFQPYSDGPSFVKRAYDRGGWAAVNALYRNPPASTEQVIHPGAYPEEAPAEVLLRDRTTEGWTRVRPPNRSDHGTLGEAAIVTMFVYPLYDSDGEVYIVSPERWLNRTAEGELSRFDPLRYESRYSSGWAGDRLHVYRGPANWSAYVWRIVWDTVVDAREFYAGYQRLLRYWGGEALGSGRYLIEGGRFDDAFAVTLEGQTVTIVNAPTVETLEQVRQPPPPTPATPSLAPPASSEEDERDPPRRVPPPETESLPTAVVPPGTGVTPVLARPSPTPSNTPATTPGPGVAAAVLAVALAVLAGLARRRR